MWPHVIITTVIRPITPDPYVLAAGASSNVRVDQHPSHNTSAAFQRNLAVYWFVEWHVIRVYSLPIILKCVC